MSDSALRMTLDRLEIRLVRKTFTFEHYWKWMTGVFDRARAAEYSSSPQQEDGQLPGVVVESE